MKRALYTFITSKQRGVFGTLLYPLLVLLRWLYGTTVRIRNYCFTKGIFRQKRLPCTVISVGNIVAGGTGKTPAVAALATLLQRSGFRVSILLRGYRRRSREAVTVVSDGENRLCAREESGDEADMLARQLPKTPIIVGKQRYLAGKTALDRFKSDILILDDGFQHRQLGRDIDILTIDATQPYGTGKLLPLGTLREPPTAVKRADIILLTRTGMVGAQTSHLKTALNRFAPHLPILESVHRPTNLYWLGGGNPDQQSENTTIAASFPINALAGKRLLAVCGIGNPEAFAATLAQYCPQAVELLAFPDHHVYTESDLQQIERYMKRCDAEWIITTQKDEQKLIPYATHLPIAVLAVELVITDGEAVLMDAVSLS